VAHSNKYGKQLESLATKQLYQQYEFDCFEDQLSFLNRCRLQSGSVCGDIVDSKIPRSEAEGGLVHQTLLPSTSSIRLLFELFDSCV